MEVAALRERFTKEFGLGGRSATYFIQVLRIRPPECIACFGFGADCLRRSRAQKWGSRHDGEAKFERPFNLTHAKVADWVFDPVLRA